MQIIGGKKRNKSFCMLNPEILREGMRYGNDWVNVCMLYGMWLLLVGTLVGTEGKCALGYRGQGFAVVSVLGGDVRAPCDSSSCITAAVLQRRDRCTKLIWLHLNRAPTRYWYELWSYPATMHKCFRGKIRSEHRAVPEPSQESNPSCLAVLLFQILHSLSSVAAGCAPCTTNNQLERTDRVVCLKKTLWFRLIPFQRYN